MPLLPPTVVAPLSSCNEVIVVRGALPGAHVEIYANGEGLVDELVSEGTATAPEQAFSLLPGRTLTPRTLVTAFQSKDEERSPRHTDGVEVMLPPGRGDLTRVVWQSRLHELGRCIALAGIFPGAKLQINDGDGNPLATGQAVDTTLRLSLPRPITSAEEFTAKQEACGIPGPDSRSPSTISFMNSELPPPLVLEPLIECAKRVYVGEVFEGATVRLIRRGGIHDRDLEGCFDHPQLYIEFGEEEQFHPPEVFTAQQGYSGAGIEVWSLPSEPPVEVQPIASLPRPEILAPICGGAIRLVIQNLVPGALVRIFNNGTELGTAIAADPRDTFRVPPLEAGNVTAQQELCGFTTESDPVPVADSSVEGPPVPTTPHECSTVVHVANVQPNARVRILSSAKGFIGEATATSDEVVIRVPALSVNEFLVIFKDICGVEQSAMSAVIPVYHVPPPSIVNSVLSTDHSVRVTDVLPGAIVEVYMNNIYRGSIESGTETIDVPVMGRINAEERVRVLQRICDRESVSSPVPVRACRRKIRVGLKSLLSDFRNLLRQVDQMKQLFRFHGFEVEVVGEPHVLDLPHLSTIDPEDSSAVSELLSHRDGLEDRDIALYLVDMVIGSGGFYVGGTNGVVVTEANSGEFHFTAHEVGHALGLGHVAEETRLMYPGGGMTSFVTTETALIEDELIIMERSSFALPC